MKIVKANGVTDTRILELIRSDKFDNGLIVRYTPKDSGGYTYETWYVAPDSDRYVYARESMPRPLRIPRQARYFQRSHPIELRDVGYEVLERIGTDCIAALSNSRHTPHVGRLEVPLTY